MPFSSWIFICLFLFFYPALHGDVSESFLISESRYPGKELTVSRGYETFQGKNLEVTVLRFIDRKDKDGSPCETAFYEYYGKNMEPAGLVKTVRINGEVILRSEFLIQGKRLVMQNGSSVSSIDAPDEFYFSFSLMDFIRKNSFISVYEFSELTVFDEMLQKMRRVRISREDSEFVPGLKGTNSIGAYLIEYLDSKEKVLIFLDRRGRLIRRIESSGSCWQQDLEKERYYYSDDGKKMEINLLTGKIKENFEIDITQGLEKFIAAAGDNFYWKKKYETGRFQVSSSVSDGLPASFSAQLRADVKIKKHLKEFCNSNDSLEQIIRKIQDVLRKKTTLAFPENFISSADDLSLPEIPLNRACLLFNQFLRDMDIPLMDCIGLKKTCGGFQVMIFSSLTDENGEYFFDAFNDHGTYIPFWKGIIDSENRKAVSDFEKICRNMKLVQAGINRKAGRSGKFLYSVSDGFYLCCADEFEGMNISDARITLGKYDEQTKPPVLVIYQEKDSWSDSETVKNQRIRVLSSVYPNFEETPSLPQVNRSVVSIKYFKNHTEGTYVHERIIKTPGGRIYLQLFPGRLDFSQAEKTADRMVDNLKILGEENEQSK